MLIEESTNQKGKKTLCSLILIDASGSMDSKKEQVIKDLKELFNGIRTNHNVNHHVIVCDFSGPGDMNVLVNTNDVRDLKDSLAEKYTTRGSTALREAIVKSFELVPKDIEGVYVNILTDGDDNSWSTKYTVDRIKKLIDEKNEAKWGITFMGTSEAAITKAKEMGIDRSNTFTFVDTLAGIKASSSAREGSMTKYISSYAASGSMADVSNMNLMDNTTTVHKITVDTPETGTTADTLAGNFIVSDVKNSNISINKTSNIKKTKNK